jgi:hypothetical protein
VAYTFRVFRYVEVYRIVDLYRLPTKPILDQHYLILEIIALACAVQEHFNLLFKVSLMLRVELDFLIEFNGETALLAVNGAIDLQVDISRDREDLLALVLGSFATTSTAVVPLDPAVRAAPVFINPIPIIALSDAHIETVPADLITVIRFVFEGR